MEFFLFAAQLRLINMLLHFVYKKNLFATVSYDQQRKWGGSQWLKNVIEMFPSIGVCGTSVD